MRNFHLLPWFLMALFRGMGLLLVWIILAGCGGSTPHQADPPPENRVIVRATENPVSFDPAVAARAFDGHLVCLIHGGLLRAATDGTPQAELARSWTVSPDNRRFVFQLKENLRFPSGRVFSSEDVRYSFSRVCRPQTGSPMAWVFEDVIGFEEIRSGRAEYLAGIRPLGATSVEIRLKAPSATLPARLTMPVTRIVDRAEIETKGESYGRNPVALGAWSLRRWVDDSYVELVPNSHYPEPNQALDYLRFRIIPRDFTAGALFETGGIHILDPLPASQAIHWKKDPFWKKQIRVVPQYNVYYLGFGCHRPPLDDPSVRSAIRSLVRTETICKTLFRGSADPAEGPIPPGLPGYVAPGTFNAQKVSKEVVEHLRGLELDLWFVESDATASLAMEAVQAELARAGIRCRLRKTDSATYMSWRREGKFDLFYANWWADYPDPDDFLYSLFFSKSGSNSTRIANADLDRLLLEARQEHDTIRRKMLYDQIVSLLHELCPAVFLWHKNHEVLTQSWVRGYHPPRLFQGTLYLDLEIHRETP